MAIYLLTPLADNIAQARAVILARLNDTDVYALPDDRAWLISFRGTSVELSNHLGITGFEAGGSPSLTSVLITSINSYYGRASADIWEWLKVRFEGAQ